MARPSLSVIVPAYNDAATLPEVIGGAAAHLDATGTAYEILVADDGSLDGTTRVLVALVAGNPRIKPVCHEHNLGFGKTIKELYERASREAVLSLPGDGQLNIEILETMLPLLMKYDIVVGVRCPRRDSWWRQVQSRVYRWILRAVFGLKLRDVNSSKLIRRDALTRLRLASESPFVDAELCLRAIRAGYRVGEVEVPHHERTHGHASGGSWRTIRQTVADLVRFRLRSA